MDDAEAGPCVGAQIDNEERDNQSAQTILDEGLPAVCAASGHSSGLSKLKRCLKKAYRAVPSADRQPLERTAGSTVAEDCAAYVHVLREMQVLTPGTLEQLSLVIARLSQPTSGAVDVGGTGGGPGSAHGVPLAMVTPPNATDSSSRASTLLLAPRPHEPSSASYRALASASTASSSTFTSSARRGSERPTETGGEFSYLNERKRRKVEGGEHKRERGEETVRRSLGPQEYWRLLGEPCTDGSAEQAGYQGLSTTGEDAWTVTGPEILQRNGVLVYADKSLHRLAMGKELCADSVADIVEMQRRALSALQGADESTAPCRPAASRAAVVKAESFTQASAFPPFIKVAIEKQLVQAGLPTDSVISAVRPLCLEPLPAITARAIAGAARKRDGPASPSSNMAAQLTLRLISESHEAAERRLYIQSFSRVLAESDVRRRSQEEQQGDTAGERVQVNYTGLDLATARDSGRNMHPVTAATEALHHPAVVTAAFDSLCRPDPIDHVMASFPAASRLAKGEADQLQHKPAFAVESELQLIERHVQRLDACHSELMAHKARLYGPRPGVLPISAQAGRAGRDRQRDTVGLTAATAVPLLVHNAAGPSAIPGSASDPMARPSLPRQLAGSAGREKQGQAGLSSAESAQSPGRLPSVPSAPSSPSASPLVPQPPDKASASRGQTESSVPASVRSSVSQQTKQAGEAVLAATRAPSPTALRIAAPSAVVSASQGRPGSPLVPSATASAVGASIVKTVQLVSAALRGKPAGTEAATAAPGVVKPAPPVRQVSAGTSSATAGRSTPFAGTSGTGTGAIGTGTAASTAATAVKGPTQSLIAELALKLPTLPKARRLADEEQKKAVEVSKPVGTGTSAGASGSAAVSASSKSAGTAAMQKGTGSGSAAGDMAVSSSGPGEPGGDQDVEADDDFADYYGSAGEFLDNRPPSPIGGPEVVFSGVSATSVSSTPFQGARAGGQAALDSGPDYPRPQDVRVEHPWEYMQKVLEIDGAALAAKSEVRERERLEQAVRNTAHNTSSQSIEQWGGHARARGAQSSVQEQRKKLANQLWQRSISGSKPQARAAAPYTSRVAGGGPVLRWPIAEGLHRPSKQGASIAGLPKLAPLLSAAQKDVLAAKKARRARVTLSSSVTVHWLPGMGPCDDLPGLTADSAGEKLGKELGRLGMVRFHALPVEEDAYFERNELLKMTNSFRALLRRAFHTPETSTYAAETEPIDFNDDPDKAKQKSSKSYDRRISASRARAGQQILEGEGYVPAMAASGTGTGVGPGPGMAGYPQMTHGTTPFMQAGSGYSGNSSPMDGGGTSPMNATTASYLSGMGVAESISPAGSPFDAGDASPALWQVQQGKSKAGAGLPLVSTREHPSSAALTQAAVPLPQRKPEHLPFELEAESSFGTRSQQSVHVSYGALSIAVPTVKSTLPIRIALRSNRAFDGAHWFGGLLQSVTDDIRGTSVPERTARYPLLCSDERCSLASQRIRPGCPFVHPKEGTPSHRCMREWEARYGQGTAAVGRSNTLPCPLDVERRAGMCVAFPTVQAQPVGKHVCSRYLLHHEPCGGHGSDTQKIMHPARGSPAMLGCYEAIVKWWNTIRAQERATDLPFDYGLMIARFYVLHKASDRQKSTSSQWAALFSTERLLSLWLARQAQESAGSNGALPNAAADAKSTRDSEIVVQATAGRAPRVEYRDNTDYRNAGAAGTIKASRKLDSSLVCSSPTRWLRMFEYSVFQKLLQCDPALYRLFNPDPPMRNYVLAWIVHMAMHYAPAAGVSYSTASERDVHDALLALQGAGRPDVTQHERESVLGNALHAAEGLLGRIAHLVKHEMIEVSPRRYTVSIQLQPSLCALPASLWRVYGCMRHKRARAGLSSSVQEIPHSILSQLDNLRPGKEPLWLLSLQVKLYRILLASEDNVSSAAVGGTGPAVTTGCTLPVEIIDALLHLYVGSNSADSAPGSQTSSYAPVAEHLLQRMIALCPGLQYVPGPSPMGLGPSPTGTAERTEHAGVQLLPSFRAAARAFLAVHDQSVQYTPRADATSWRYPFIFLLQAMLLKCPGNCLSSQWVRAAYIASGGPDPSVPLDEAARADMTAWQSRVLSWLAPLSQNKSTVPGSAPEESTEHPCIGMLLSGSHVSIGSEAHYQRIRLSFENGKVSIPDVSFWLGTHCWDPPPKIAWPAISAAELPQAGFTPLEQSILGFLYDFKRACDARQIESGLRDHYGPTQLKGVTAALRRLSSTPILAVRERKQSPAQKTYDACKSRSYWGRQEVLRAIHAAGMQRLSMSQLDACVPTYCRSSTTTLLHIVKDMQKEKVVVLEHEVHGDEHSPVVAVRLVKHSAASSSAGTGPSAGGAGSAVRRAAIAIQLPAAAGTGNAATPLYSETPIDSPAAQACGLQCASSSTMARAFAPTLAHGAGAQTADSTIGSSGPTPVDATGGSILQAAGAGVRSSVAAVSAIVPGVVDQKSETEESAQPAQKRSRFAPPEPNAPAQTPVPALSVPSDSVLDSFTQAAQPGPPLERVTPTAAVALESVSSADMSIDPDETQPVGTTAGSSPSVPAAAAPAVGSIVLKKEDVTLPSGTGASAVKSAPASFVRRGPLASHPVAAVQPRGATADAASSGILSQSWSASPPRGGGAIRDPDAARDPHDGRKRRRSRSRSPSYASRRSSDRRHEDRRGERRSPDRTGYRREESRWEGMYRRAGPARGPVKLQGRDTTLKGQRRMQVHARRAGIIERVGAHTLVHPPALVVVAGADNTSLTLEGFQTTEEARVGMQGHGVGAGAGTGAVNVLPPHAGLPLDLLTPAGATLLCSALSCIHRRPLSLRRGLDRLAALTVKVEGWGRMFAPM